jgi:hypothetical protein
MVHLNNGMYPVLPCACSLEREHVVYLELLRCCEQSDYPQRDGKQPQRHRRYRRL